MTNNNIFLQEINNIFGQLITTNLSSTATSKIYEAYIFSIIIQAARNENAQIVLKDIDGNVTSNIVFRGAPGYIFSRAARYTFAEIIFPGKPLLEAHVSVRVTGKSGVLHEFDISVVYQTEAEQCRLQQRVPRSSKVLIEVECKFYSTNLQLILARAFRGLLSDISVTKSFFVTNQSPGSFGRFLSYGKNKWEWEHNIVPNLDNDVNRLRSQFQSVFKDFKVS